MKTLPNEYSRFAFLDGKFDELGLEIPHTLMPVVSDNYKDYFQWDGVGEMPPAEYALMDSLVRKSHSDQKTIRFWGGTHTMEYTTVPRHAGVDVIGYDNLDTLY